jgi:hypothetical protein
MCKNRKKTFGGKGLPPKCLLAAVEESSYVVSRFGI